LEWVPRLVRLAIQPESLRKRWKTLQLRAVIAGESLI
jgi:hypothetical protein